VWTTNMVGDEEENEGDERDEGGENAVVADVDW
jgi:hypothetical protein